MSKRKRETNKLFVCIDLEAISNTKICAIGVAVGNEIGVTLEKREWWLDAKPEKDLKCTKKPDECMCSSCRCKREFWDKHPELVQHMALNKMDEEKAVKEFVQYYDSISEHFGTPEEDIELITDNPEFDFGLLNTYVKKYCNRDPLRYTTKGKYRSIQDKVDFLWDLGIGKRVDSAVSGIQEHNHLPSNDAEHNYLQHLIAMETLNVIKKQIGPTVFENIADVVCKNKIASFKRNRTKHANGKVATKKK